MKGQSQIPLKVNICQLQSIRIDASTACQLKCPTCPNAEGIIDRALGTGFLKFEQFKDFMKQHPQIPRVELSNWGEVFLNPELVEILKYANRNKISITIKNGANLNSVSEEVLEALVRYKVESICCSLDGASQETYSLYRVNGNFEQVIGNIQKINQFKLKYKSFYPILKWQFICFGHNEHEIDEARSMAKRLSMSFVLKLSWDDLYGDTFSPVQNAELIREATSTGVANRTEYEKKYHNSYIHKACNELWLSSQLNCDGRVLGCSVNYWDDYGNAFSDGLEECLNGHKMVYAREMLLGIKEAKPGIPCTTCKIYAVRKRNSAWINSKSLGNNCMKAQIKRRLYKRFGLLRGSKIHGCYRKVKEVCKNRY